MASDVNDITIQYEEDGQVLVQQLDKEILTKGAWATIIFRYKNWSKAKKRIFQRDVHHQALPKTQRGIPFEIQV